MEKPRRVVNNELLELKALKETIAGNAIVDQNLKVKLEGQRKAAEKAIVKTLSEEIEIEKIYELFSSETITKELVQAEVDMLTAKK